MKNTKFNGFASEEQYEQVAKIVIDAIDDYTDYIMVSCRTLQNGQKTVEIDVDTKSGHSLTYYMDSDGVFYVNKEGVNFPIQECKILVAIDRKAGEIFDNINGHEQNA